MSSLVPGTIFITSGLNRKSTPTPPDITPAQLDKRYKRVDFNGHDWPCDSPVSRMYDVCNTSTKLIILNNKYGQNSTRLRGYYTGPKKPDRHIDPERHRATSPRNPRFHEACYDSSSPKFEPDIRTSLDWISSSHRPSNALIARTSVNPRRHASCRASPDPYAMHDERTHSRASLPPKRFITSSENADLSMGEKIYLWSIQKIYSMDRMKKLKQEQYRKLLDMEARKGYHGYQEYVKYMRYINSAKDRSYGTGSPSDKRSRSAFTPRSQSASSRSGTTKSQEDKESTKSDQPERPKTSIGQVRTEPLNDTKQPSSEEPQARSASTASQERKSLGSEKSPPKSPASSRKSSAKSQRSPYGSQKSLRSQKSKTGSTGRSPSKASLKAGDLNKGGDSNATKSKEGDTDSLKIENDDVKLPHKEGKDRPLSRLGHPEDFDHDKDSLHSSTLSIKSDTNSLSSDSGVGKGRTPKATKVTSYPGTFVTQSGRVRKISSPSEAASTENRKDSATKPPEKKMGSRVSLSSKSSTKSDQGVRKETENYQEEKNKKEKLSEEQKTDSKVNEDKNEIDKNVLKIPSASFSDEETGVDVKHSDDEKESKAADIKEDENPESPVDKQTIEAQGSESDRKEGILKLAKAIEDADNKEEEEKETDRHVHYEDEQSKQEKVDLIDESIALRNVESDSDKNNEDSNEKQHEEKPESQGGDAGSTRLVPERKDSFFDEDDDDRRANKDLDKIEY